MAKRDKRMTRKRHYDAEGVRTTFVRLGRRVPGVLYEPATASDKEDINVLVTHSDEDYMTFPTGPELAVRGYTVLCANVMNKEGRRVPKERTFLLMAKHENSDDFP